MNHVTFRYLPHSPIAIPFNPRWNTVIIAIASQIFFRLSAWQIRSVCVSSNSQHHFGTPTEKVLWLLISEESAIVNRSSVWIAATEGLVGG